jgi:hypothetical protein
MRAFLPIEQTMLLFVPAVAACALVGWWAGGRAFIAVAWVSIAVLLTLEGENPASAFYNLARGWSLLLAGAFGLVCLFGARRPVFSRALTALAITLACAVVMSLIGPVTPAVASRTVAAEFERRNAESMTTLNDFITAHPKEWQDLSSRLPQVKTLPEETGKQLKQFSGAGLAIFRRCSRSSRSRPSLWAGQLSPAGPHSFGPATWPAPRVSIQRPVHLGFDHRADDRLAPHAHDAHRHRSQSPRLFRRAVRRPRSRGPQLVHGPRRIGGHARHRLRHALLPFLSAVAVLAFMALAVAAVGLGLGDTWADWRSRARSTS